MPNKLDQHNLFDFNEVIPDLYQSKSTIRLPPWFQLTEVVLQKWELAPAFEHSTDATLLNFRI